MQERILVVEDEPAILTGIVDLLTGEQFKVSSARDGKEALRLYAEQKPDLILLDIMIPEKSGYDVCKEIRKHDQNVSILILTAKGQEIDKVVGLEIGADDYIVKPFGVKELIARIRAALRRNQIKPVKRKDDTPINFGDIYIDPKTLKGRKKKKEFDVIPREIELLRLFLKHDKEILERFTILNEVWGYQYEGSTRTLDQHIVKLRQKIEDNPSKPKYINTAHGVGYRFCSNPKL